MNPKKHEDLSNLSMLELFRVEAENQVATALIMLKTGLSRAQAVKRLKSVKGNVREAIERGHLK